MHSTITLHTAEDSLAMAKAGRLAAQILDFITEYVKPGITTNLLDSLCHEQIVAAGAVPAPLNYKGFPKSICTSVNHVVCHGIPNDKLLNVGDIINIDVTVILDGWHGDASRMYWVGKPSTAAEKLTLVTYEAMMLGIEQIKPGNTIGDIAHAIQTYAEKHHYSVVRDYCGHGIGRVFHDLPSVPFFGRPSTGVVLQEGMFFTVEPMINIGTYQTKLNRHDGWTVTTKDRMLSAQFEHTIGVTRDGFEIFTISPCGLHCPPYNG